MWASHVYDEASRRELFQGRKVYVPRLFDRLFSNISARFVYTDYAIVSTIDLLVREGSTSIGVFYDIFCHWSRKWDSRIPKLLLPNGPMLEPEHFYGGVPKYHLAGHIDACYARFSLNNMAGVGRLDAEGCERAWANLNQAAGSTSEKGHGSRIDALNHCMQDWNWKKIVGIGTETTLFTFVLKSIVESSAVPQA